MGDMIDRVAEAICQADEQNGGPSWGYVKSLGKHAVNGYHDRARAAIEALRNPPDEFLTYLQMAHDLRPEDWSDVIDTALTETKTQ